MNDFTYFVLLAVTIAAAGSVFVIVLYRLL